jgi:hypothetical protein
MKLFRALLALQVFCCCCCCRRGTEAFARFPPPSPSACRGGGSGATSARLSLASGPSSSSVPALVGYLRDRFVRLPQAQARNRIHLAEERRATHALEGLRNELARTRATHRQMVAMQGEKARSRDRMQKRAEVWRRRSSRAYGKHRLRLYRHAWDISYDLNLEADKTKKWMKDHQANTVDPLKQRMQVLEREVSVAMNAQREARTRLAQSKQEVDDLLVGLDWRTIWEADLLRVNDMLSGLKRKTNFETAFRRMEEKVVDLEASAEVSVEMAKLATQSQVTELPSLSVTGEQPPPDVELQFRAMEEEMESTAEGNDDRDGR